MYNPCIAIDVSKGKSHIQGFLNDGIKVSNAKPIPHTKDGFTKLRNLYDYILMKTHVQPLVIFEYTGVYHKSLEKYLNDNNIKYHIIPPLKAAKIRKTELHDAKNDKKDCATLSQVYYMNKLGRFYKPSKEELQLRELHKKYCMDEHHYQKVEVNFYELLDTLYPNYHSIVSEVDSYYSLYFLKEYPHPTLILKHRKSTIIRKYMDITSHSEDYATKFVDKLFEYLDTVIPSFDVDSLAVESFDDLITQLIFYKTRLDITIEKIYLLTHNKPLFIQVLSIPGIGKTLACRFVAEVGDISRFSKHSQLVSYTGLDPTVYQSGNYAGLHLSISKRGNKRLRRVLFLMARSMIRNLCGDNQVSRYFKNKTAQPNCNKKVVLVACANKLIKIIFQMYKKNEQYSTQG